MKIYFLMANRPAPAPNPVLVALIAALRQEGHQVGVAFGDQFAVDLSHLPLDHDLYVLKSRAPFWSGLARLLAARGARVVDSVEGRALTADKVQCTARLIEHGVPVPSSWAGGDASTLRELATRHPLILKPIDGEQGRGIVIVPRGGEPAPDGPVLVQEYVQAVRPDLKVYAIGSELFGFRKAFEPGSHLKSGEPEELSSEVREIVKECGRALGLSLFGVDIVETDQGMFVVDVNYFPSYRAIPDAAAHLARFLSAVGR